jgi:hypothetical protein
MPWILILQEQPVCAFGAPNGRWTGRSVRGIWGFCEECRLPGYGGVWGFCKPPFRTFFLARVISSPPKRRFILNPHGARSQKTPIFEEGLLSVRLSVLQASSKLIDRYPLNLTLNVVVDFVSFSLSLSIYIYIYIYKYICMCVCVCVCVCLYVRA